MNFVQPYDSNAGNPINLDTIGTFAKADEGPMAIIQLCSANGRQAFTWRYRGRSRQEDRDREYDRLVSLVTHNEMLSHPPGGQK